ncbi:uncharacterized protein [Nothobranchius furzeri]
MGRTRNSTQKDNELKEEEQEEIMELSASEDFLSDSSYDLDSDYIPLAPPSSEDELTSSQSKLMKTHDALKNPGKTSLSQSYVHEQKTLMDSGKSNEALDKDYNADTEEENPEEYEDDEGRSCVTVKTCTKGDKRKYDKRQYCVYCQKPLSKMARHLIRKRGDEKEVAQATFFVCQKIQRNSGKYLSCCAGRGITTTMLKCCRKERVRY